MTANNRMTCPQNEGSEKNKRYCQLFKTWQGAKRMTNAKRETSKLRFFHDKQRSRYKVPRCIIKQNKKKQ
jgi:hypothetical protein